MSDIVERLRAGEVCLETGGARCWEMSARGGCLCAIAADEIEQLRAALQGIINLGGAHGSAEYARQADDIARAALQEGG